MAGALTIAEMQAQLLAERNAILAELGLANGPLVLGAGGGTGPKSSSSTRRSSTHSSEKRRRAAIRSTVKLAKARASGKTRKRLGANLKLLEEAGALHKHLRRGAPLTGVAGTAYHGKPGIRRRN
jgi:hypothetical protein